MLGRGSSKQQLEDLETIIVSTLSPESRYNRYTNWRKRGKILNPFYGHTHTSEARKAQSVTKIGKKSNFAGHKQTNQVKQIISQHNAGYFNTVEGRTDRRKPLYIDSLYYESVSEVSEKTGLSRRLIRKRCHSQEKRFQHYRWAENCLKKNEKS